MKIFNQKRDQKDIILVILLKTGDKTVVNSFSLLGTIRFIPKKNKKRYFRELDFIETNNK